VIMSIDEARERDHFPRIDYLGTCGRQVPPDRNDFAIADMDIAVDITERGVHRQDIRTTDDELATARQVGGRCLAGIEHTGRTDPCRGADDLAPGDAILTAGAVLGGLHGLFLSDMESFCFECVLNASDPHNNEWLFFRFGGHERGKRNCSPSHPPKLGNKHRAFLAQLVEDGAMPLELIWQSPCRKVACSAPASFRPIF
jgi:hypothetical protein